MIKIVHINATDARGGAAIAMKRHSEAMNRAGFDSRIVVANHPSLYEKILQSLFFRINHWRVEKLQAKANFSLMNFGLPLYKKRIVRDADIIFLHWLCENTLSIDGVEQILKLGKPTFWYMHDMFPFTGGCHYSLECNRYTHDCKNCPQIGCAFKKNMAAKQLAEKIEHWSKYSNLEFIAPSTWESKCAEKSTLCRGHKVHVVANILDTDIYKPLDIDAKVCLGLDPNKRTILFGATRIGSPYKGSVYARECLSMLDPKKYEGLVLGKADKDFISGLPIKVVQTGFLTKDEDIALAYNACDTFLMTSIAESFGQVVAEAMACGKPCVGFPTGGVTDLIRHKESGFLTTDYYPKELKEGITWLFEDKERYGKLSYEARRQIVKGNSFMNVLDIHSELNFFKKKK